MIARRFRPALVFLAAMLALEGTWAAPLPPIPRDMNEQVAMIPIGSGWSRMELETTLFSPPGPGPFPLVVINHGKASGNPRFQERARYPLAVREFLQRGYLVALPMRSGFSKSGGGYIETGCNTESNGLLQAEQIDGVLTELVKRPDVDKDRILLVGQSHGGLTVLAMGAKPFPGVRGILNFAGGYRVSNFGCSWEKSMADAFAAYGKTATVPSLWFYGDNDSYWGAELPRKAYQGYREAGGKARLVAYGQFAGGDAHAMIGSPLGLGIWLPEVEKFMQEIGLPWEPRFAIAVTPRPPATDFARLDDVAAVPYLDDKRRGGYRKFLGLAKPRAFAIAATGNIGWATGTPDPLAEALANCEKFAKMPCQLYAVDDDVVWNKQ